MERKKSKEEAGRRRKVKDQNKNMKQKTDKREKMGKEIKGGRCKKK